MKKPLHPQKNPKKQRDNITKFDYTTIADRIRTVNLSYSRHPLVLLNRFTSTQPFHSLQK